MTDKETDKRRELLRMLVGGSEPESVSTASVTPARSQIGTPSQAVDKAHLNADSLEWLEQRLHPDGKAYLETVELDTELGTICFKVEDGQIVLSFGDRDA